MRGVELAAALHDPEYDLSKSPPDTLLVPGCPGVVGGSSNRRRRFPVTTVGHAARLGFWTCNAIHLQSLVNITIPTRARACHPGSLGHRRDTNMFNGESRSGRRVCQLWRDQRVLTDAHSRVSRDCGAPCFS